MNGTMTNRAADLVGKAAVDFYKAAGVSITPPENGYDWGTISYGNWSVSVRRIGLRSWEVRSGDRCFEFGSQWELFAWVGDRM